MIRTIYSPLAHKTRYKHLSTQNNSTELTFHKVRSECIQRKSNNLAFSLYRWYKFGGYSDTNQTLIIYLRFLPFSLGLRDNFDPQQIHIRYRPNLCHAWHVLHLPWDLKGNILLSGTSCLGLSLCFCSQVLPIPSFLLQAFLHMKGNYQPSNPFGGFLFTMRFFFHFIVPITSSNNFISSSPLGIFPLFYSNIYFYSVY